jgi:flagellar hook-basal body complex protein FliE
MITTERSNAMTLKQNLAEQVKAQSDIWRAQAKDYQERLGQAGEQARTEYKKAMEQMEAKIEDAAKLAERVRNANEAAWKDMVTASQKAFAELQRGWADAVSRFQ